MNMVLPEAYIRHASANRLRIGIPSKKNDASYFSKLQSFLIQEKTVNRIETNPLTGSILISGPKISTEKIAELAESGSLFRLAFGTKSSHTLSQPVIKSLSHLNQKVEGFSQGAYDLWELIFMGLLGFGIYEILKGNVKSPPWYTFFWYALGIYTKSIIDRTAEEDFSVKDIV